MCQLPCRQSLADVRHRRVCKGTFIRTPRLDAIFCEFNPDHGVCWITRKRLIDKRLKGSRHHGSGAGPETRCYLSTGRGCELESDATVGTIAKRASDSYTVPITRGGERPLRRASVGALESDMCAGLLKRSK